MGRSWKIICFWGTILLSLRITHQATNLALGGVAVQSSVWDLRHVASLGIDGKPYSDQLTYRSCFATQWQNDPWWRVDLRAQYDISTVELIRRTDCCVYELDGAEIRIGNSLENNGNNNPRCAVITVTSQVIMTYHCSQMKIRYINIFIPGVNKRLQLCEVRVYAASPVTGANVALGGVSATSSLYDSFHLSSFAIDGKPYSDYQFGSCFATQWQVDPWWRVDMRGPYDIISIEVIRRTDCCIYELDGAEVRIGNSLENNGNNNPRCAVITVTSNPVMTFNCSQMDGRYVNIFLPGVNKRLQLCEVMVYAITQLAGANLTLRGVATQSSKPASVETAPDKAIDEHPGPWYALETCASVPLQDKPWWQLDLRSVYHVTAVSIMSTGDCCSGLLNGAEVRIGLRNDTSNQRCAIISIAAGQQIYNYQCGIMEGRFVHVVLPGLQKTLTVCEVQVYGTVLENVALRGVAFNSPSSLPTASEASRVIDGHQFSTCSTNMDQPGQWVTVDLLVPYSVTAIQLAYSEDCCDSYDVLVDNTSCNVSTSQSPVTLDCGGIVGRFVTVINQGIEPPLCEVNVYSTLEALPNSYSQLPPPYDYCSDASCSRDYILIYNEPKTWFEAQTYCRERHTDLGTINNAQDMKRVVDKMENYFNDFWIGLYEDVVTWRWSLSDEGYYGEGEDEFRNWGVGEPSGTQDCAGIQATGEWKDLDCALLNYFLCFDGRVGAPETKVLVEVAMNWADAQRYCRTQHTDLLSVRNQDENYEIQSMVPAGNLTWIGLFQDSWKWSDGSYSSFRYWSQGPLSSGEGPNCAYVYDRKWSVRSCNTKSMFLCYYYKKKSVVRISADFDMSDPVVQQQILNQLEAQMKNSGISDFQMNWRMSGRVAHEEEKHDC